MSQAEILADTLWKAGTFLILTAWILGSGWVLFAVGGDVYSRWGSWQTYPIPDKRAMKHLVGLMVILGVWALFLWFAVMWFTAPTG